MPEFIKTKEYIKIKNNDEFTERINKIYALIDPRNNTIFYIGCTISPIHIRISQHYYELCRTRKKEILQDLLMNKSFPKVKILYRIKDKLRARIAEKYLTHFLINNKLGIDLTNNHGINKICERVNLSR